MCKVLTAAAAWTLFQFFSLSAGAQTTPDAQAILKKVNETYHNLKSYQFEYNMVSDSKTEREDLTATSHYESRGRVTAVRPTRIHFERQDPNSSVIFVADGQTVWMYSSELNGFTKRAAGTVQIFAPPKSTDTNHEALAREANRKVEGYAQLAAGTRNLTLLPNETLTFGGRQIDCYVLEFTQGTGGNKSNTRYWIDRERYLVLRELVDSFYRNSSGSTTKFTQLFNFTTATINEPAADSAFSYTPPKNAVELDRLDKGALAQRGNAPVSWIGQAAPDFTLTDMDGKTVSLQSLRGKVVLLNFWATWCGPCRSEMPHLEKLHREYKNKDIVILGIDDEEAAVVQAYLKKNGYTFNTLIDTGKQVSRQYRISAIPQSFFITKDGVIAAYARGTRTESEFRDGIKKALAGKTEAPTTKVVSAGVEAAPAPAALSAPKLTSPEHGSRFDHYPRATTLVWEAVPGAAGYRVQTDYQSDGRWSSEDQGRPYTVAVKETAFKFDFVGAQPGRWRVWAVDAAGREGAKSEWREFVYSR